MNLSLLQLDHYAFTEQSLLHLSHGHVSLKDGYPSFEEAAFSSHVDFHPLQTTGEPGEVQRYAVRLTIKAEPKDLEAPKFPYRMCFDVVGFFNGPGLPVDKREALIAVNGASLLYGAVRETVLMMTSRSMGPALLLPSVKFDQLIQDMATIKVD
jgi:preprotein translocase subunit SecB